MKSRSLALIIATLVLTRLAAPNYLPAQEHHHYKLIDIGTFGGPSIGLAVEPIAQILNNQGVAVGEANTGMANPYYPNVNPFLGLGTDVGHAFAWQNGVLTDLGTLPGGLDSGASWINQNGLIAGISENGEIDPLLGVPQGIAVLWYHDGGIIKIINLGTLDGGYESVANSVNIWGQVTGPALNTIHDPYSMLGLGTQTRAFIWEAGVGMRDLGTLGGPDAFGLYINDLGQIAGQSYTNSTPNATTGLPTQDPFLWEFGKMLDLGTLGGVSGLSNALNNRGEVVGQSDVAGDQSFHAFLWTYKTNMQDLGTFGGHFSIANWLNDAGEIVGASTLPGDEVAHAFDWKSGVMTDLKALQEFPCSFALAINSSSQIVGQVDDCISVEHAALWEDSHLIDLNVFVPQGSGIVLEEADYINDGGEIIGYDLLPNGDEHGFVLIPCNHGAFGAENCDGSEGVVQSLATGQKGSLTPRDVLARFRSMLTGRNRRFGTVSRGGTYQSSTDAAAISEREDIRRTFSPNNPETGGKCVKEGGQCPPWTHCCPGLACSPASDRAFCVKE
jgi:probable HAF family extracellular repeat protein